MIDVSRKTLIITYIINLILIGIAIACIIVTKADLTVLILSICTMVLVVGSSLILLYYAQEINKNGNSDNN